MPSGESVEPLRFADDDDPDDLGGFSRGKRSYDDDEDEDGGWAINEDHSDRLWDSAEDADDDEEVDSDATVVSEGDEGEDEEEEEDLFGGGAPRGRRGRPKGSGKRQESSLTAEAGWEAQPAEQASGSSTSGGTRVRQSYRPRPRLAAGPALPQARVDIGRAAPPVGTTSGSGALAGASGVLPRAPAGGSAPKKAAKSPPARSKSAAPKRRP